MDIDKLNKEQKEAVLMTEGPLLILAGAGSGKTRVLTTKVAYLIEEKHVDAYNILAITFTNKAAREMLDRVNKIVGDKAKNAQISTFHSFGVKILRDNYKYLGYDRNFVIMDSEDSLTVIKKILKEKDLDPKSYNPNAIRNKISSCKNDLMDASDYEKYALSDYEKNICMIFSEYEKILKSNNSMDFDDLLKLPIKLFREHKEILEMYQERFKYILIDEYQDTNEAQYILTKMISKKYRNICCVGDIDQSIYSFRGANYKNILNFEKDFKDATIIKLEQNYRSTTTILEAANDVIKNNKERKDKKLWSNNGTGEKISYYSAFNGIDEAKFVVREIKKLIDKGIDYQDIAVLYRTNAQSRSIEDEFVRENVPYHVVGTVGFYSRKEIKDLLAYLRVIYNEKDDISLLRIINVPKRGIGNKTISNLIEKANEQNKPIYEVIDSGKELAFKELIEKLKRKKEQLTITELIDVILDETGIREEYKSDKTLESDIRLENLDEFKSVSKAFEDREGVISLEDFLLEISLVSDTIEKDDNPNKVNLMTVHAVKGLEFGYVFIVGLEEGLLPHMNSFESESDLEEERRLFYVAITRAKEKLYLVNAKLRMLFGNESTSIPSRFIKEINSDLIDGVLTEIKEEPIIEIESKYNTEDVEYNKNDYVYHEVFGQGKVIEVSGSMITVAFKLPYGVKKLLKNHKSLSKI